MGTSTCNYSRIDNAVVDAPDVLYTISQLRPPVEGEPIEIVSELPAATDADIILGYIMRWHEIQEHFNCELRVYAWCHTTIVEKYVLGIVQNMSHINVTTLPTYLRGRRIYDW